MTLSDITGLLCWRKSRICFICRFSLYRPTSLRDHWWSAIRLLTSPECLSSIYRVPPWTQDSITGRQEWNSVVFEECQTEVDCNNPRDRNCEWRQSKVLAYSGTNCVSELKCLLVRNWPDFDECARTQRLGESAFGLERTELIPVCTKKSMLRVDSLKIYSKGHSLPHIRIYSKR